MGFNIAQYRFYEIAFIFLHLKLNPAIYEMDQSYFIIYHLISITTSP